MKWILLFLISVPVFADSRCEHLKDDCEYYSCISHEKSCSRFSYPQNFGRRYCLRYAERSLNFSEEGQLWISNVKRCLISEMESFESKLSCSQLRKRAFRSHVPCYVRSGFCQLNHSDKLEVLRTIWPSVRNVQILANGFQIVKACGPFPDKK